MKIEIEVFLPHERLPEDRSRCLVWFMGERMAKEAEFVLIKYGDGNPVGFWVPSGEENKRYVYQTTMLWGYMPSVKIRGDKNVL